MRINSLIFKNFKSFGKETHFEIRPLTLIYGVNGSGKSSIIQLLQFLKQSYENRKESILSPIVNLPGTIDLGSYEELINKHDLRKNLEITFKGEYLERWDDPQWQIDRRRILNSKILSEKEKNLKISELEEKSYFNGKVFHLNLVLNNNLIKEINLYDEKINKENKLLSISNVNDQLKTNYIKIDDNLIKRTSDFLKNEYIDKFVKFKFNENTLRMTQRDSDYFISIHNLFLKYKKNINNNRLPLNKKVLAELINNLDLKVNINIRESIRSFYRRLGMAIRIINSNLPEELSTIVFTNKKNEGPCLMWDLELIKKKIPFEKSISNQEALVEDLEEMIKFFSKFSKQRIKELGYISDAIGSLDNQINLNFSSRIFSSIDFEIANNLDSFKLILKILKKKKIYNKDINNIFNILYKITEWDNDGFLIHEIHRGNYFRRFNFINYPHILFSSFIYERTQNEDKENKRPLFRGIVNTSRFVHRVKYLFPNFPDVNETISNFLDDILHLSPQSVKVPRFNTFKGSTPSSVGSTGENMPDLLFRLKYLVNDVNDFLEEINLPYSIKIETFSKKSQSNKNNPTDLYEIRIKDKVLKTYVHLSDTGYGISQLVTFLVQLINSSDQQIIMKEELEAHLHPSWQKKIPDLIFKKVSSIMDTEDEYLFRCILETHSEHLILKINKMIKEKIIRPKDVAVYYAYKDNKTKSSHIDLIRINEDGEFIDKWRDGFFMERLELI